MQVIMPSKRYLTRQHRSKCLAAINTDNTGCQQGLMAHQTDRQSDQNDKEALFFVNKKNWGGRLAATVSVSPKW